MKRIKISLLNIGTVFLLTFSFFLGLLTRFVPGSLRFGLLLGGLFCFCMSKRNKREKQQPMVMLAVICIFIVMFNRNARFSSGEITIDACVIIGLIVFCLSSNTDKWHQSYNKYLLWMGVFYGLTTIFLFLFPSIYFQYVYPLFRSQSGYMLVKRGFAVGFTPHYSVTAIYLSAAASVTAIPLLRGEVFDEKTKKRLILLFVIVYGSILLTGKRAHSVFVLIAGITVYWFINKDKNQSRFLRLIIGLTVFLAIFFIAAHFYPPLYNVITRFEKTIDNDNLLSGRDVMIEECLEMFKSSPFFGTGWGSFTLLTLTRFLDAHNVYLQLLAENGVILSLPFYCFFFLNWFRAAKAASMLSAAGAINNQKDTTMLGAALLFQTFFLFYCLTGNPLYDSQAFFPYIFSCSIGEYYYRRSAALISRCA